MVYHTVIERNNRDLDQAGVATQHLFAAVGQNLFPLSPQGFRNILHDAFLTFIQALSAN